MRVVFDTNILFSAILFGGVPRQILCAAMGKYFTCVSSPSILTELSESLHKKSNLTLEAIKLIENQLDTDLEIVYPKEEINVCRDKDDNQILEAAVEGDCDFIITGDKDLLDLKKYQKIKIITPAEFVKLVSNANDDP